MEENVTAEESPIDTPKSTKNNKDFKCDQCPYATSRRIHLKSHTKVVHDKIKDQICTQCGYATACRARLNRHIKEVHNDITRGLVQCNKCDYSSNGRNVAKHKKIAHRKVIVYDKNFKCDRCDYVTSRQIHLDHHVKGVHDKIKDHKCDACDFATAVGPRLRRHVLEVHEKVRGDIIKCDQCDYKSVKRNLWQHRRTCHGSKNHRCRLCSYAARTSTYLAGHVRRVHAQAGGGNFKCGECDLVFGQKCSLSRHSKGAHGKVGVKKDVKVEVKNDFKCKQCDFTDTLEIALKKHMKESHKQKCEKCNYAASVKKELVRHVRRVHELRKNHKCGKCDFASFDKRSLRKHVSKSHVDKLQCQRCTYSSQEREDLQNHVMLAHGDSIVDELQEELDGDVPNQMNEAAVVPTPEEVWVKPVVPTTEEVWVKLEPKEEEELLQDKELGATEDPLIILPSDTDDRKPETEKAKDNVSTDAKNETTIKVKGGVRLRDIARKPFGRNIRFNNTPLTDHVLY